MLASGVQPGERLASPAHHTDRAYTRAMSTLITRKHLTGAVLDD
jgi:hypothetical protein